MDKNFDLLHGKKNLLAFSAGVDSSALFFLLEEAKVDFDVIHVNYQARENSDIEALHVKNLAKKHGKKAYMLTCKLQASNFEHNARRARYDFFEKVIDEVGYENLILAHQLDDRFEWLMMQLCKGAGASELVGFFKHEKRRDYTLVRPLLHVTKKELLAYLKKHGLPYFEDESNKNTKYTRNKFRHEVCTPLLKRYQSGIKKSLAFLSQDAKVLNGAYLHVEKELYMYTLSHEKINMRLIDKAVKKLGEVMSEESRKEALQENAVINHKIAVGHNETHGFIAPYVKAVMPKSFKEECRVAKIPKHIRAYLYKENIEPIFIYKSLSNRVAK